MAAVAALSLTSAFSAVLIAGRPMRSICIPSCGARGKPASTEASRGGASGVLWLSPHDESASGTARARRAWVFVMASSSRPRMRRGPDPDGGVRARDDERLVDLDQDGLDVQVGEAIADPARAGGLADRGHRAEV